MRLSDNSNLLCLYSYTNICRREQPEMGGKSGICAMTSPHFLQIMCDVTKFLPQSLLNTTSRINATLNSLHLSMGLPYQLLGGFP